MGVRDVDGRGRFGCGGHWLLWGTVGAPVVPPLLHLHFICIPPHPSLPPPLNGPPHRCPGRCPGAAVPPRPAGHTAPLRPRYLHCGGVPSELRPQLPPGVGPRPGIGYRKGVPPLGRGFPPLDCSGVHTCPNIEPCLHHHFPLRVGAFCLTTPATGH